jgi:AcrR family transcriptional regulator
MTTAEEIECVALALLESHGAPGVTMRKVAKAVKITPMAIYHHFRNREVLLQTVVDREFAKFLETMTDRPVDGSHQSNLLHSLDAYIHYSFEHPRIFDYVFSEKRPGARRYPDDFRAGRSPTLTPLAAMVRQAMKDDFLRPDDPWEVAIELWAHVHGYVMLFRGGRINLSEEEFFVLVHRSIKRLINGLKNH